MNAPHPIIPREKLDFGLDSDDIPKYWLGGDPFKTRFFDAMSTLFPEGERYFIASVRAYREDVTDPVLLEEIKHFIRQEAQHGIIHTKYNERLKRQGIPVEKIERIMRFFFFTLAPKVSPRIQRLTETAATEHMTAIMAHCLFTNKELMDKADPRVRAMYAWHAIEEVEHKSVAFDVMQKIAKVGYLRRSLALINTTFGFNMYSLLVTNHMLKVDGMGFFKRVKLMTQGTWWLFKPGGLYAPALPHYMEFFKPSFHPWQSGTIAGYQVWQDVFAQTGDPVLAGEALHAAAAD
jgi:predicted metal-dependent hydrolase